MALIFWVFLSSPIACAQDDDPAPGKGWLSMLRGDPHWDAIEKLALDGKIDEAIALTTKYDHELSHITAMRFIAGVQFRNGDRSGADATLQKALDKVLRRPGQFEIQAIDGAMGLLEVARDYHRYRFPERRDDLMDLARRWIEDGEPRGYALAEMKAAKTEMVSQLAKVYAEFGQLDRAREAFAEATDIALSLPAEINWAGSGAVSERAGFLTTIAYYQAEAGLFDDAGVTLDLARAHLGEGDPKVVTGIEDYIATLRGK